MAYRWQGIGIWAAACVLAAALPALANPLQSMEGSSIERLKQSGGFGLTSGNYAPPKFSVSNNSVVFEQTRTSAEQDELGSQSAPSATYSTPAATHSHGNSWKIGNGWLGAGLEYLTQGNNDGDTYSGAFIRTTILGKHTTLIGAQLTVRRDYGSTSSLADDKLKYSVNRYFLGQATGGPQGDVNLGHRFQPEHDYITQTKIYQQQWRYVIGVVPVVLKVGLSGKFSTGRPYAEFGSMPGNLAEIRYRGQIRPYGSLVGYGDASILGDVPNNVKPGDVQLRADVKFLTGALQATAHGDSTSSGPCLRAEIASMDILQANVYVRAWWNALKVLNVETFVKNICNNGWVTIPGCSAVTSFVQQVANWVSFDHREDIFNYKGFRFNGDWKWLEQNYCQQTLPSTRVRMCNKNPKDIFAAYGSYNKTSSQWESHGWHKIEANGCKTVSLGNYDSGKVYLYAEYGGGQVAWSGASASICLDRQSGFDYPEGFNASLCQGSHQKMARTSELNVVANTLNHWEFQAADPSLFEDKDTLLRLCNEMPYTNYGAIHYGGRTVGWYEIPPFECKEINLGDFQGEVHTHAAVDDKRWGIGDSIFCVDYLNRFDFPANHACQDSLGGDRLVKRKFYRRMVQKGQVYTETFSDATLQEAKFACNRSNRNLKLAYGLNFIQDPNRFSRESFGWQDLPSGRCLEYASTYPRLFDVYVYAKTNDSGQVFEWAGQPGQIQEFFPHSSANFHYQIQAPVTPFGADGSRDFLLAPQSVEFGDYNKQVYTGP